MPRKKRLCNILQWGWKKNCDQNKLLFHTIHDLISKLKNQYSGDEKIPSFSYFMSLKPVECIHAGDLGSHYICVCAEDQNVKFRLYSLSRKMSYQDRILNRYLIELFAIVIMKYVWPKNVKLVLVEEYKIQLKKGEIKYKNWIDKNSAASLKTFSDNSDKFISQYLKTLMI